MRNFILLLSVLMLSTTAVTAQVFGEKPEFTRQDTLRGAITPERAWWDLKYYHLSVDVNLEDSTISGTNLVRYEVLDDSMQKMQIDLQEPMKITKVVQFGQNLKFEREGNAYFISILRKPQKCAVNELTIHFEGKPRIAVRPPWDGGFTWKRDSNGKPFIANSNQGIGASIWWPNKDHAYDEVESMRISVTAPSDLVAVSNGRLEKIDGSKNDKTRTWHWYVSNPINNYGVNINIGDYVNFGEIYEGEKGELDMDYYVLKENKEKAIKQFAEAPRMIKAFEHWFGPYPFYEDSYKLVEVPYLGMEHQSSVTYGNNFENGYLGRDLSQSGWGLRFDFIIIHESAHEWFANSITHKDIADMWIHEGFASYAEALFLEYHFGKTAGEEYILGIRQSIQNDRPIIGVYGVHYSGSSDMYNKGSNMLHTIRQVVDNDTIWRATLRGLSRDFYHKTVTTEEFEEYISESTGIDLSKVFDQYLRDYRIPILEYSFKNGQLLYRWNNVVNGFNMPVKVFIDGHPYDLKPNTRWQRIPTQGKVLVVEPNYYVGSLNTLGN